MDDTPRGRKADYEIIDKALLEEALKRPGVREAMLVFRDWQQREANLAPYRNAIAGGHVAKTTDHANSR